MPQKRQSIEAQRAAHARAKAKWRQQVAGQRNQSEQAEQQFINRTLGQEVLIGDKDADAQLSSDKASEAGDAANPLFRSYEASEADEADEANEAEAEDAPFQFRDDDSDIEAVYKAVDIDIDTDIDIDRDIDIDTDTDIDKEEAERLLQSEGELQQSDIQSDAYDSDEDGGSVAMDIDSPSSDDVYREADDEAAASMSSYEAAEAEDDLYEASELGLEVQLQ